MVTEKTPVDDELVKAAFARLEESFDEPIHSVASAIRTKDGKIITAMNFKHYAHVVCAEMAALSVAQNTSGSLVDTVVSVRYINSNPEIINSCGRCRQVLADCSPKVKFILNNKGSLIVGSVEDVLPYTYEHHPRGKT